LCGVPVIASRTGGLPEAAGEGALLLDPHAGPDAWAAALASVWDHPREYRRRSRPEPRPELRPAVVAEGFEAALLSTVGRFAAAA
jgi:glycosyltransferase involved in cell wall biosynthesis